MDFDRFEAALEDLRSQKKPNITKTAQDHGVSHSQLLKRWNGVHGPKRTKYEEHQFLSNPQEEFLVQYINRKSL